MMCYKIEVDQIIVSSRKAKSHKYDNECDKVSLILLIVFVSLHFPSIIKLRTYWRLLRSYFILLDTHLHGINMIIYVKSLKRRKTKWHRHHFSSRSKWSKKKKSCCLQMLLANWNVSNWTDLFIYLPSAT